MRPVDIESDDFNIADMSEEELVQFCEQNSRRDKRNARRRWLALCRRHGEIKPEFLHGTLLDGAEGRQHRAEPLACRRAVQTPPLALAAAWRAHLT